MKMQAGIVAAALLGTSSALTLRDEPEVNRPVSKVITLLKDMEKQLAKEGEEDEEVYKKMKCWCKTNDEEKTKSIAEAQQREKDLDASIEEGTAKSAQLTAEIDNLEKELAANQQALNEATSLRQKESKAFNAEEKDLIQSISSLKSAVTVLSKHNSSMLQQQNASAVVQRILKRYGDNVLATSDRASVTAFLQAGANPYANQSGEIFGIMKNMLETMESDLADKQKEEAASQKAFEELKSAKGEEISAGQDQVDKKTAPCGAAQHDQSICYAFCFELQF